MDVARMGTMERAYNWKNWVEENIGIFRRKCVIILKWILRKHYDNVN
jgi:hypothetical protein